MCSCQAVYRLIHFVATINTKKVLMIQKTMIVKWALGSITTNKASWGDGIPVDLFQILKDDAVKVLHSIYQKIWKTQQWPLTGKGQLSFQLQRRAMPKNVQTTAQLHSFHMVTRLQQYMNWELPDVQAGFWKGRGTRDEIANIHWIIEKASEFHRNIYFCFIDYAKVFDCVVHNKLENSTPISLKILQDVWL